MKKYVINTFHGIAGGTEAYYSAKSYAESIGAELISNQAEIEDPENAEIEYVDGFSLYYRAGFF